MDLRKSIFSYIVWAGFAVLCCFGMVSALEAAGLPEAFGLSCAGIVGGVCGYLLLTAAVFMALRTICMELGRHVRNPGRLEMVCSIVLPVLVLVGVVVYLVYYLIYHTPVTLEDDSFYRQALVFDGNGVAFSVHGASWLYTCLLHVMLLVFGNTPFAGVVLQIVLYFLCLLLLYIGMQAFAGTLPAAVSMAFLGFLPVSLPYVFSLTPEFFHLALYLSGFCLTGILYKRFKERGITSPAGCVLFWLSGLYTGVLSCLDISGLSFFFFFLLLGSVDKEKIKQAAGAVLSALFGGICGFFLASWVISLTGGMPVLTYLQSLFALYFQETGVGTGALWSGFLLPDITLTGCMLLITLSFFLIPAFFLWKRSQGSAFIMNLFFLYGLSVFSVSCLDVQMVLAAAWSLLAGLGIYGVVRLAEASDPEEDMEEDSEIGEEGPESGEGEELEELAEKRRKKKEKQGAVKEKQRKEEWGSKEQEWEEPGKEKQRKEEPVKEEQEKEEPVKEKQGKEEPVKEERENKERKREEPVKEEPGKEKQGKKERGKKEKKTSEKAEGKETAPERSPEKKKEQEKPAPGEPLHNPLPVPKKKKRSAVDFGYPVKEEEMKFDIEVKDTDDFDW